MSESDYKAVFDKGTLSKPNKSIFIKLTNIGKTDIDEIVLSTRDVINVLLYKGDESLENNIKYGRIQHSQIIYSSFKIGSSVFIKINTNEKFNSKKFYLSFKGINGFYWEQSFNLNNIFDNEFKTKTPILISPFKYKDVISYTDLNNYILLKSYYNYENDPRFEYHGNRNELIDKKFKEYKDQRDELVTKSLRLDEKYNFTDFNLYD